MAGFVDGEGLVTITRQLRKDRPSPAYRVYVTVCNTKPGVLSLFRECYGGAIYCINEHRKDWNGKNWADAYSWYCSITATKRFLTELLPYLRLKRPQAELVLQFISMKKSFARGKRRGRGGSSPLTEEEIVFREELRTKVRLLNSKGRFARSFGGGLNWPSKSTSTA